MNVIHPRPYSLIFAFWQLSISGYFSAFNRTINLQLQAGTAKASRNKITTGECHVGQYR
jgi:hypothetical protein